MQRELRGLLKPMLISLPIVDGLHLSFKYAAVESNAHPTSRQLFKDGLKAVVSAACTLKI
jgi:hypothetical protein